MLNSNCLLFLGEVLIARAKATDMLLSKRLEPIEISPGVGLLSIIAFEYKAIQGLKPYNEFGTFIPVNYRRGDGTLSDPGVYCLHLPVTTEMARWGGVAVYGFPKIAADIEFTHDENARAQLVLDDDPRMNIFYVLQVYMILVMVRWVGKATR